MEYVNMIYKTHEILCTKSHIVIRIKKQRGKWPEEVGSHKCLLCDLKSQSFLNHIYCNISLSADSFAKWSSFLFQYIIKYEQDEYVIFLKKVVAIF